MKTNEIQALKEKVYDLDQQGKIREATDLVYDKFDADEVNDKFMDIDFQDEDCVLDTLYQGMKDSADSYDVDRTESDIELIRKVEASPAEFFDAGSGEFDPIDADVLSDVIDELTETANNQ